MSIVPLFGHAKLRARLGAGAAGGVLPSSLLIHGPPGVGKQRLGLWLGQLLLCTAGAQRPCDNCTSCGYGRRLAHPDLHWYFPRPRLTDANPTSEQVREEYLGAIAERAESHGLYAPPEASDGIYVATVRAIVQAAAYTPKLGRRKVFIIGDAERMVPQEGADAAANAFLKLLEEPPADTTIVLTSSEPGALLPTIRSRVVAFRAASLPEADVRAFVTHEDVKSTLDALGLDDSVAARIALAAGAPGALLGGAASSDAMHAARTVLAASVADRAEQIAAAFSLGGSRARGRFSDILDALTVLLHERMRGAVANGDVGAAVASARAVDAVEEAKLRAAGNVNPQLLGTALVRRLSEVLA